MQLSDNSRDSLDANSPSVLDLLQVMGGVESPVVVQNITESDAGVLEGGQPASVPGLSDLLNLGNDPVAPGFPRQVFHRHWAVAAQRYHARTARGPLVVAAQVRSPRWASGMFGAGVVVLHPAIPGMDPGQQSLMFGRDAKQLAQGGLLVCVEPSAHQAVVLACDLGKFGHDLAAAVGEL